MEDEIVWSWNVSTRQVSAKLTNDASFFCVEYVEKWRHKSLWKWDTSLKLIFLCWLVLENKVIT